MLGAIDDKKSVVPRVVHKSVEQEASHFLSFFVRLIFAFLSGVFLFSKIQRKSTFELGTKFIAELSWLNILVRPSTLRSNSIT